MTTNGNDESNFDQETVDYIKLRAKLRALNRQMLEKGSLNIDADPSLDDPQDEVKENQTPDYTPPYKNCYIAGLAFHGIDDIWDELDEGVSLALVRQRDNKYDANAVAVALADDYDPEDPESFDFDFILGYIPRTENEDIAAMMDAGYRVEAKISELNRHASYNKRIEIAIYVLDKVDPQPSTHYRALSIDADQLAEMRKWLSEKGIIYYRWCVGFPIGEKQNRPVKGENVVVMHRGEQETQMYLTKVIAVGDEAGSFFDNPEDIDLDDDCVPYILSNIDGPVTIPNWSLDIEIEDLR